MRAWGADFLRASGAPSGIPTGRDLINATSRLHPASTTAGSGSAGWNCLLATPHLPAASVYECGARMQAVAVARKRFPPPAGAGGSQGAGFREEYNNPDCGIIRDSRLAFAVHDESALARPAATEVKGRDNTLARSPMQLFGDLEIAYLRPAYSFCTSGIRD
jgi:hypothetical protein